eukprot:6196122-Pleurochrysis_carterae.AAC.1
MPKHKGATGAAAACGCVSVYVRVRVRVQACALARVPECVCTRVCACKRLAPEAAFVNALVRKRNLGRSQEHATSCCMLLRRVLTTHRAVNEYLQPHAHNARAHEPARECRQ